MNPFIEEIQKNNFSNVLIPNNAESIQRSIKKAQIEEVLEKN